MSKNEVPEVHPLDPVRSLWEVWPHEAYDFTPWLVKEIGMLNKALNMELEVVETEKTLPGAGRVDIYAKQANTGEVVLIENQLGTSDDSHCLRLLGYAAKAEANILVWIAGEFNPYHLSILKWLNEADTINVYAVKAQVYHVGDVLAADFQTVVEPSQSRGTISPPVEKSSNTLYAEFYRPLVARLHQGGIQKVGRGGWRGRWRSFQTGLPGAIYVTRAEDKKIQVFLSLDSRLERFRKLRENQEKINRELPGTVLWTGERNWFRIILERKDPFSLNASEAEWEVTRQWMAENLHSLRKVIQPHIDRLREDEEAVSSAHE